MASGLLGRTNRSFPSIWLSLSLPHGGQDIDSLAAAAKESQCPINVTGQPALWGAKLRGTTSPLICISSIDYQDAQDEAHACHLVQAHMIQVLSCLGREKLDFYYLRVRRAVEEFQISGALQAMELAKQEGHIEYLGICSDGPAMATLANWQFHNAFDTLLVPRSRFSQEAYQTLEPLARERRVGVVTSNPFKGSDTHSVVEAMELADGNTNRFSSSELTQFLLKDLSNDHPVLVDVRSAKDIEQAVASDRVDLTSDSSNTLRQLMDSARTNGGRPID